MPNFFPITNLRSQGSPVTPNPNTDFSYNPDVMNGFSYSKPGVLEIRNQATSPDSAGGFLVPTTFDPTLWTSITNASDILRYCTVFNTQSGEDLDFALVDDISKSASRVAENATASTGQATFARARFASYKYHSEVFPLSVELLQDAPNIESVLEDLALGRIARGIENDIINGTGSGQPKGLLVSSVLGRSGASAGKIEVDDLIALAKALGSGYYDRAVWVMNPSTLFDIYLDASATSTQPYTDLFGYHPLTGELTLLNFPIVTSQAMPTIATSAKAVLLGDLTYFGVRLIQNMQMMQDSQTKATQGLIDYFGYWRSDQQPFFDSTWSAAAAPIKHLAVT